MTEKESFYEASMETVRELLAELQKYEDQY